MVQQQVTGAARTLYPLRCVSSHPNRHDGRGHCCYRPTASESPVLVSVVSALQCHWFCLLFIGVCTRALCVYGRVCVRACIYVAFKTLSGIKMRSCKGTCTHAYLQSHIHIYINVITKPFSSAKSTQQLHWYRESTSQVFNRTQSLA